MLPKFPRQRQQQQGRTLEPCSQCRQGQLTKYFKEFLMNRSVSEVQHHSSSNSSSSNQPQQQQQQQNYDMLNWR